MYGLVLVNLTANLETSGRREFVFCLFLETECLCVALKILELDIETRLASNSQLHLPLPLECRIKGVRYHTGQGQRILIEKIPGRD